jgi:hypothetical protein
MMPAEFGGQKSRPTVPSEKQQSLKASSHSVINILALVWTLALLVFFWAVAIVLASVHNAQQHGPFPQLGMLSIMAIRKI